MAIKRHTVIVEGTLAFRMQRVAAARAGDHGRDVATLPLLAARLAERRGLAAKGLVTRLSSCLLAIGLPTEPPDYPAHAVLAAMRTDKKRLGGRLRLVLPLDLGDVRVFDDVSDAELVALLTSSSG